VEERVVDPMNTVAIQEVDDVLGDEKVVERSVDSIGEGRVRGGENVVEKTLVAFWEKMEWSGVNVVEHTPFSVGDKVNEVGFQCGSSAVGKEGVGSDDGKKCCRI